MPWQFLSRLDHSASRRRSRRRPSGGGHRTTFEPLEDRALFANLHLNVQLWTEVGGQKGAMIPTDPAADEFIVARGSSFLVQVVVDDEPVPTDVNQVSAGVIGLSLDLDWNTAGTVIGFSGDVPPLAPAAIPLNHPIVTDQFPQLRRVTAFDPLDRADDLRGGALPVLDNTTPIGIAGCNANPGDKDSCREFSLLRFDAVAAGTTSFTIALAGSMSFADADQLDQVISLPAQIRVVEGLASLSGFVYVDSDNDGVRDVDPSGVPVELGIPNVEISLLRQNETVPLATYVTGPGGFYHFENLLPGTYQVRESQPLCFLDGRDTLGVVLPGQLPRGTAGQDEFSSINLVSDEAAIDYNFGELGLAPPCVNKRMFLASAPPAQQTIASRVGLAAATVRGTPGADTIAVDNDGQVIRVSVNSDPPKLFDVAQVKLVTIDAGEGIDTVSLVGTASPELACFEPGYLAIRRDDAPISAALGYAVEVIGAEQLSVDAGPVQNDVAVLRDSPQADALVAAGNAATLVWGAGGRNGLATRFQRIRAIALSGGADTADEQAPSYVLDLLGNWQLV
jgi:hypothetical protein